MSEIRLKQLNRLTYKPYISIKDPVSALTHFIGFLLAIFFTPVLLSRAALYHPDLLTMVSLSIYCLSMIILYGASSAYHSFVLPERPSRVLKKIDHISVFLLIAGTYTPICLCLLKDKGGIPLLIGVWSVAVLGIIMKLFWIYCPRYVSSIVYIAMGWLALIKIKTIWLTLAPIGFFFLLTGGLFYTIGGIIYALKIKINEDWSEHEIFHIFVLLGSLCHYIMIFSHVI